MKERKNTNGYMAVGGNGSNRVIGPMDRDRAREVAESHPGLAGSELVGLVDLGELARSFGILVSKMKIKDAGDLHQLVELIGTMSGNLDRDAFVELTGRTLGSQEIPSIKPFAIDETETMGLEEIDNAEWHGNPTRDRDMVLAIVDAANRAGGIDEPTVDDHEISFGLMQVGYGGQWPASDLFVRLYVPSLNHVVGDVLPLEDGDFFETCVALAGTETGPAFGKAVLTMVMFHASIIYRDLAPLLNDRERELACLEAAPAGKEPSDG